MMENFIFVFVLSDQDLQLMENVRFHRAFLLVGLQ